MEMSRTLRLAPCLSLLVALSSSGPATAAPMAGTLVVLEGEVRISRGAGGTRQVRDYARMEQGDKVVLDTASKARISLFDSRSMVLLPGETYQVERDGIVRLRDGVGVQVLPFSVPLGTTGRARQFDSDVGGAGTLQVAGEVWVRSNTSQDWRPVNRDREVLLHDWVRTGADGRAVLATGNAGVVLIEQESLVQLQGRELVLEYGAATLRARRNSDRVEIHTAELRIESRGGLVRAIRQAEQGSRVSSFGQRVVVQPRRGRGRLVVHPGQVARVGPAGELLGVGTLENPRVVKDWRTELRERLDGVPPGLGERLGHLHDLLALAHHTDDSSQPLPRTTALRATLGLDAVPGSPAGSGAAPMRADEDAARPPPLAPSGLPEGAVRAPRPVAGHPATVIAPPGTVLGPARPELGGEASPLMKAPASVSFDTPSRTPAPLAAPGQAPPPPPPSRQTIQGSGDWVVQVEKGRPDRAARAATIRTLAQPSDPAPSRSRSGRQPKVRSLARDQADAAAVASAPPPAPTPAPAPARRRRRRRRRRNPWEAAPRPEDPPAISAPVAPPAPPAPPAARVPPPAPARGAPPQPPARAAIPPRPSIPPRVSEPANPAPPRPSPPPRMAQPPRASFGNDPLGGPSDLARAFQL